MKKAWILIAIALVLAVVIIGAKLLTDYLGQDSSGNLVDLTQNETTSETENTQASEVATEQPQRQRPPDFTVYDAEGNQVKLSDMRGKPVIVNFWNSWCTPCKTEMPDFEEAYKAYGDQIVFMMVNLSGNRDETLESAQSYIEEKGFTFPVYFDMNQEAAVKYSTLTIPATYFYDADGYLVTYHIGMLSAEKLELGIGMLLE